MPSLSVVKPADRFKAMHVGRSGGGKTIGAASLARLAPPGEKIFIFDNDGRIRPILKLFPDIADRIDFESYGPKDFNKLWDKCGWLNDKGVDRYWAAVMDGLTMLGDMTMSYSMKMSENAAKALKTGVIDLPEIQDYKAEMRGVSAVLDELRTFPRHFILTAHLVTTTYKVMNKATKKEEDRVERSVVTQGRKIGPKVPIYFDEIYLFMPEVAGLLGDPPKYKIYTCANEYYEECRTALSLPTEIDWTMKPGEIGLYERILEEVRKNMPDLAQKLLEK